MRGAGRLFLAQVVLALTAIGLLAAGAVIVFESQHLQIPSAQAVSQACSRWLARGGPGAVLGIAVSALALAVITLALRSLQRQVRATRRYLALSSIRSAPNKVAGTACQIIEVDESMAFCAGYLRPRVYISRGALQHLDPGEIHAVLAHESHHVSRRDPLRLLAARTLADALFFMPVLRRMSERYSALGELAADEAAVTSLDARGPLAAAMLKLSLPSPVPMPVVGIAPERVDHLMGDPDATRWRLPSAPLKQSILSLVLLAGVTGLMLRGAISPNLEPSIVFAAICMTAMVCGPLVLGLVALILSRRALRWRRA